MDIERIDSTLISVKKFIANEFEKSGHRLAVVLIVSDHPKGTMSLGVDLDDGNDDSLLIACSKGIEGGLRKVRDTWPKAEQVTRTMSNEQTPQKFAMPATKHTKDIENGWSAAENLLRDKGFHAAADCLSHYQRTRAKAGNEAAVLSKAANAGEVGPRAD